MCRRIRCRTRHGRRHGLRVLASDGHVCLAFDDGTYFWLHRWDVGKVRADLRDKVILAADHPDVDELS